MTFSDCCFECNKAFNNPLALLHFAVLFVTNSDLGLEVSILQFDWDHLNAVSHVHIVTSVV